MITRKAQSNEVKSPEQLITSRRLAQPISILGSHKSGSSLLRRLLDGHPTFFVIPTESYYFQFTGHWVDYGLRYAWPKTMSTSEKIEFLVALTEKKNSQLLTSLFVLIRTTPLVSSLNGIRVGFVSFQGALHAVTELLNRDDKPYFQDGHKVFQGLHHSIDFASVDFSYNPGGPVLHDITLSIKRGETTALVGAFVYSVY